MQPTLNPWTRRATPIYAYGRNQSQVPYMSWASIRHTEGTTTRTAMPSRYFVVSPTGSCKWPSTQAIFLKPIKPHGRWRILNYQQHLEALVVEVEARDLDDAGEIGRRLVESVEANYTEVLVYVQEESPVNRRRLRRVKWTRNGRFETLDF